MKKAIFAALILFCSILHVKGQNTDALSTYTPYSIFGIGQLENDGTAYNMSMGGIGIAMRNNGFINFTNPASITARDTLAFMFDFGANQKNIYDNDNISKSANNTFNVQNVAMSFPIYRKSAFMVGIAPLSNIGYKFLSTETNDDIVADIGDIKYQKYGTGSLYKLFLGVSAMFFDRISIGAEGIYYFGNIQRHSDILFNSSSAYNTIYTGWQYKVHGFSGKFGLQYIQPFKKNNSELIVGGTYKLGTSLNGSVNKYAFSSSASATDTVIFRGNTDGLEIADEFGVGISYGVKNHWTVGFDYIQQNWQNVSFVDFSRDGDFAPTCARYYKAGFEYTPNWSDIRYYMKRVTYRGGVYYEQSYVTFGGRQVNTLGLTLGATFPIHRRNSVTIAVNLGQRGSLNINPVRERFVTFTVGISLYDTWFIKYKYD